MNGTRTNICNMVSKRTCGEKYYAWYFDYHDKHCKMVSHIACTGKITVFPTEKSCQFVCLDDAHGTHFHKHPWLATNELPD
uniref:Pancreatic trypsin inhibitor n=1 Tax=Rhipicephalus zambeziensis TaxID=60191 RepID=A0A224YDC1_9ACAR